MSVFPATNLFMFITGLRTLPPRWRNRRTPPACRNPAGVWQEPPATLAMAPAPPSVAGGAGGPAVLVVCRATLYTTV